MARLAESFERVLGGTDSEKVYQQLIPVLKRRREVSALRIWVWWRAVFSRLFPFSSVSRRLFVFHGFIFRLEHEGFGSKIGSGRSAHS